MKETPEFLESMERFNKLTPIQQKNSIKHENEEEIALFKLYIEQLNSGLEPGLTVKLQPVVDSFDKKKYIFTAWKIGKDFCLLGRPILNEGEEVTLLEFSFFHEFWKCSTRLGECYISAHNFDKSTTVKKV